MTTPNARSLLQDDVQYLCQMVDTAIGHSSPCSSTSSSPTTRTRTRTNSTDSKRNIAHLSISVTDSEGTSSRTADVDLTAPDALTLSPRTFNLAKSDLSKVDQTIVSRMNSDTLLTLFPSPPQQSFQSLDATLSFASASNSPSLPCMTKDGAHVEESADTTETTTTPTTTTKTETTIEAIATPLSVTITTTDPDHSDGEVVGQAQVRKQKLAARRNWVIPPGSVLIPSLETCDMSSQGHISSDDLLSTLLPRSPAADHPGIPWMSSYASHSCISLPEREMRSMDHSETCSISDSFVSTASVASLPESTRSLDNLDSLSHRLWAFEMQMRRDSFLVDDRASVLSRIVPSSAAGPAAMDGLEVQIPPLRLVSTKASSRGAQNPYIPSSYPSSSSSSEVSSPVDSADMERGWYAWQAEWTRTMGHSRLPHFARASTLSDSQNEGWDDDDGDNSTAFSSIRSSHSSVVTTVSQSSQHLNISNLNKFDDNNNNHNSSSISSKRTKPGSNLFLSSKSMNSKWSILDRGSNEERMPMTPHSIKDANPALWETEHGQKWSDRFQFLVHNFQAAAGKHTRRLADIIPKSKSGRWSAAKRSMRSRHGDRETGVGINSGA
ncbi:hypothetical protein BG004_002202 [Podila humilis]|nr:hypothetical protein BG004_002202 [Podila humilis]